MSLLIGQVLDGYSDKISIKGLKRLIGKYLSHIP